MVERKDEVFDEVEIVVVHFRRQQQLAGGLRRQHRGPPDVRVRGVSRWSTLHATGGVGLRAAALCARRGVLLRADCDVDGPDAVDECGGLPVRVRALAQEREPRLSRVRSLHARRARSVQDPAGAALCRQRARDGGGRIAVRGAVRGCQRNSQHSVAVRQPVWRGAAGGAAGGAGYTTHTGQRTDNAAIAGSQ